MLRRVCRSFVFISFFAPPPPPLLSRYLKIQLEDVREYRDALEYIASLSFREAKSNMEKYGKELVMELPEETTALLKKLCTEYKPSASGIGETGCVSGRSAHAQTSPHRLGLVPPFSAGDRASVTSSRSRSSKDTGPKQADPEAFIHLFVSRLSQLRSFLKYMVEVSRVRWCSICAGGGFVWSWRPGLEVIHARRSHFPSLAAQKRNDCSSKVYDTLLELLLRDKEGASLVFFRSSSFL